MAAWRQWYYRPFGDQVDTSVEPTDGNILLFDAGSGQWRPQALTFNEDGTVTSVGWAQITGIPTEVVNIAQTTESLSNRIGAVETSAASLDTRLGTVETEVAGKADDDHEHDAADIVSGTLAVERMPSFDTWVAPAAGALKFIAYDGTNLVTADPPEGGGVDGTVGSIAIADVTGLQDVLDTKLESVAWGDVTGKPASFPTTVGEITDLSTSSITVSGLNVANSGTDWLTANLTAPNADRVRIGLGANATLGMSYITRSNVDGGSLSLETPGAFKWYSGGTYLGQWTTDGLQPVTALGAEYGGHGIQDIKSKGTGYLKLVQSDPPVFEIQDIVVEGDDGGGLLDDLLSIGLGTIGGAIGGWFGGKRPPRPPDVPDIDTDDLANLYIPYAKDIYIDGYGSNLLRQVTGTYHWDTAQVFDGGFRLNGPRKNSSGNYIPYVLWDRDQTLKLQFRNSGLRLSAYDEAADTLTIYTELTNDLLQHFNTKGERSSLTAGGLVLSEVSAVQGKDWNHLVTLSQLGLTVRNADGETDLATVTRDGLVVRDRDFPVDVFTEADAYGFNVTRDGNTVAELGQALTLTTTTVVPATEETPETTIQSSMTATSGGLSLTDASITRLDLTRNSLTMWDAEGLESLKLDALLGKATARTLSTTTLQVTENIQTNGLQPPSGDLTVFGVLKPAQAIVPAINSIDLGTADSPFRAIYVDEVKASANSVYFNRSLRLSVDPDGFTSGGLKLERVEVQIDPETGEEVLDPVTGKPVYNILGIEDVFAKRLEAEQLVSTGTTEADVPDGASIAVSGSVHAASFHGDGSALEGVSKVGHMHPLSEIGSREVMFPGWTNPLTGPIDARGYVFQVVQDGVRVARLGAYVLGGGGWYLAITTWDPATGANTGLFWDSGNINSTDVDLVVNEPLTAGQWYVVWAFPAGSTSANFRSVTLPPDWSAFPFLASVGGVTTTNSFIDTPSAMATAATAPITSDYRLIDVTFEIPGIELSQLTSVEWDNVANKPAAFPTTWDLIEGKPDTGTGGTDWGDITNKPTSFPSDWSTVANKPSSFPSDWSSVANKPTSFPTTWADVSAGGALPVERMPDYADWFNGYLFYDRLTGKIQAVDSPGGDGGPVAWTDITGKPSVFPTDWSNISGGSIPVSRLPNSSVWNAGFLAFNGTTLYTENPSTITGVVSTSISLTQYSNTGTTNIYRQLFLGVPTEWGLDYEAYVRIEQTELSAPAQPDAEAYHKENGAFWFVNYKTVGQCRGQFHLKPGYTVTRPTTMTLIARRL